MNNNEETIFIIEADMEPIKDLTIYNYTKDDVILEYFIGSEITKLLKYKNADKIIRNNVSKSNIILFKDFQGDKLPVLHLRSILLSKKGVIELMKKLIKRLTIDKLPIFEKVGITFEEQENITQEIINVSKIDNFIIEDKIEEINIYNYMSKEYFIAKEILVLLNYQNINKTTRDIISNSNIILFKDFQGDKIPSINSRTLMITKDGIIELLLKSLNRLTPYSIHIFEQIGIEFEEQIVITSEIINISEKINYIVDEKNNELLEYSYISNGLMFEYFVGFQIATLLGYNYPVQTIKNMVPKSEILVFRDYPGIKTPLLDPRTILITRDGATELLSRTRKRVTPDMCHILKKFGIEIVNKKCLTKEQQTLSSITNVLKTELFDDQKKVGKYYLDLYFTEYRFVIECDENGHKDRKPCDERERMDFINKELQIDDSNWIRFNPDEKDYDVHTTIRKILTMFKIKGKWEPPYKIPTHAKKNINLELEKPCTKCNIMKKLEDFNSAKSHRDKRENICKKCKRKRQKELAQQFIKENPTEIKCNMCNISKDISKYYKDKNSSTGHMRKCKECHKERSKILSERSKISILEKRCTRCKETKEVKYFGKLMVSPDGYKIYCSKCDAEKTKIWRNKIK